MEHIDELGPRFLYQKTADIKGIMAKNKATRKLPPSETKMEVLAGQNLTVSLADSDVKLTIHHGGMGKPRIFGVGTSEMRAVTFKRSGGFSVLLPMHRSGDTFEFFKLLCEIRDQIYGITFQMSPSPPSYLDPGEDTTIRTKKFHLKRPVEPLCFLARLSKSVTGGGAISFANHKALRETTGLLIRSKHDHVCGDKKAYALLKSMGVDGLNTWPGSLTLHLDDWEIADGFRASCL